MQLDSTNLDDAQRYLLDILDSGFTNQLVSAFVRKHGKFFKASSLPKGIRGGQNAACFANSYQLLKRHGKRLGLAYVEGYAVCGEPMHPHLHAWCVDRAGIVYDRTWKSGWAYFGIELKDEYVLRTIKEREKSGDLYFGFLDDWKKQNPLIKELENQPHIWKLSDDRGV